MWRPRMASRISRAGAQFAARGRLGHLHQLIGDAAHGADHDQRLLRQARGHDGGDTPDGGRILYRAAAKFHDNHYQTP